MTDVNTLVGSFQHGQFYVQNLTNSSHLDILIWLSSLSAWFFPEMSKKSLKYLVWKPNIFSKPMLAEPREATVLTSGNWARLIAGSAFVKGVQAPWIDGWSEYTQVWSLTHFTFDVFAKEFTGGDKKQNERKHLCVVTIPEYSYLSWTWYSLPEAFLKTSIHSRISSQLYLSITCRCLSPFTKKWVRWD